MSDSRLDLSSFSNETLYRLTQQKKLENDRAQNPQTPEKTTSANLSGIVWTEPAENNSIENPNKKTDKNPLKIKSTHKPQISVVEAVDQVWISSAVSTVDTGNKLSGGTDPKKQQIETELAQAYEGARSHNSVYARFKGTLILAAVKARALFHGVSFKEQGEILARVRQDKLNDLDNKIRHEYAYPQALVEITMV